MYRVILTAMVLSLYIKQRILFYYSEGFKSSNRINVLEEEGVYVSWVTIWKFLRHYDTTMCIGQREGSGRPSKITPDMRAIVERQMERDDKITAYQIYKLLQTKVIASQYQPYSAVGKS